MEKTFKCRAWAIMYVVSIGTMLTSCNKQDIQLPSQGLTVEQARMYLSQKSSGGAGVGGASGQSVQQRLANAVNWGTARRISDAGKEMILAEISDRGISIAKDVHAKRYAVFTHENGSMKMNIIEDFDTRGASLGMDPKRIFCLLKSPNDLQALTTGQFMVLYNEAYQRVGGNAVVQKKPVSEKKSQAISTSGNNMALSATSQNVIGVPCETWGVFLVTYDQFGNEIDSQLLYTFTTGDCSVNTDNESIPPDYGGGGSQSLADMEAEIWAEFRRYANFTSSPEIYESYLQDNINQGVFTWSVARGALGGKVEAVTRYAYYRTPYRDVNTLQEKPSFRFTEYKTFSTRYVGPNMLVESKWSGAEPIDIIHNNDSENASCESFVTGTLNHKWKGYTPVGMPPPEWAQPIQNSARFIPR